MYRMLQNIANEINVLTSLKCHVWPYHKQILEPALLFTPRGTSIHLRGPSKNISCETDAEIDLAFTIELVAAGISEDTAESFYNADILLDKLFSKRLGMINVFGKPSCTVEFKKRVNGGTYAEIEPTSEEGTDLYIFQEIWDCVAKYINYT